MCLCPVVSPAEVEKGPLVPFKCIYYIHSKAVEFIVKQAPFFNFIEVRRELIINKITLLYKEFKRAYLYVFSPES